VLVARVLPDVSGIERVFDYLVGDSLRARIAVGSRVRVVLNGRRVAGWVTELGDPDPALPLERLQPLLEVIGHGPDPHVVALSAWAARQWCGPRRAVLVAASPPRVVRHLPDPRRFATSPAWLAARHPLADELVTRGGGLLRWPPTWDLLAVIASVAVLGPTLVVAPSVAQAEVLARRAQRLGASVAVLPRDWSAAAGGVDVVFGARGAIWGPCAGLGAIVVLDEHDEAHHEERAPTWHAPDVAVERARRAGVPIVAVSPCPSLTARLRWGVPVAPSTSDERDAWPVVDVIDVGDRPPWERSPLTPAAHRWLGDAERRVVCISNTTGQARLLACRGCGDLVRCTTCDAAVAQLADLTLSCRRCGSERPPVCASCGSSALSVLRPGLARLRRDVEAAARRPVLEVTARSLRDVDASSPWSDAGVVIGTEAALHRVRRADVVVFCDLDAELLAPRYRSQEQVVALVARAARLVGPRSGQGRIVIQTALGDHPVFRALQTVDLERLVPDELARRQALGWPPAGAVATVEGDGSAVWMAAVRDHVGGSVRVMGPADGRFLVRADTPELLGEALASVARPTRSRCRVVVDPPRL
jgi:primosomal protein N' (replication factor Y) (superfamily II helicase)